MQNTNDNFISVLALAFLPEIFGKDLNLLRDFLVHFISTYPVLSLSVALNVILIWQLYQKRSNKSDPLHKNLT
ncbi:hypothetical protein CHH53_10855 [Terribacillus sp. 7520-G]|nr:hypothetical protein CHH53_10855 [Terribacillus sp. 7520-G]